MAKKPQTWHELPNGARVNADPAKLAKLAAEVERMKVQIAEEEELILSLLMRAA